MLTPTEFLLKFDSENSDTTQLNCLKFLGIEFLDWEKHAYKKVLVSVLTFVWTDKFNKYKWQKWIKRKLKFNLARQKHSVIPHYLLVTGVIFMAFARRRASQLVYDLRAKSDTFLTDMKGSDKNEPPSFSQFNPPLAEFDLLNNRFF